jgi:SAM-dependent methyltransferase
VGGDQLTAREPFVWENGVLEIPVDISSPEAGEFSGYLEKYDALMKRKNFEPTFNIVMHSWSLTRRNPDGHHYAFEQAYEDRLHQMCQHATDHGAVHGYGDYMDSRRFPRPAVKLSRLRSEEPQETVYVSSDAMVTCNMCDAVFSRSRMTLDCCLGCGMTAQHRQLRNLLDTFGDIFNRQVVLAHGETRAVRRALLSTAVTLQHFDPNYEVTGATDLQDFLSNIEAESVDCVLGLRLLGRADIDEVAIGAIARVLKTGGVLVSAVPDGVGPLAGDDEREGLPNHSANRLGLMSKEFTVSLIPGYDPIMNLASRFALAFKR